MLSAKGFWAVLKGHAFGPCTGVPCSILKPLINYALDNQDLEYYTATSEGEAMGLAAGFALAGKLPVVMMQNSGLGNAINPLTSLHLIYNLPVLLLISWRGEPGKPDEPEHRVMGSITLKLLDVMGLRNEALAESGKELEEQILRLKSIIVESNMPAVLIVRRGILSQYVERSVGEKPKVPMMRRKEAIKIIVGSLKGDEAIISTTGKISRELYCYGKDSQANFYVVGSMGCAISIGFGIAQTKPDKKVIVLDGDGAVLMKMGTLATVGHYKPLNLIHIVLDNASYDSTGGQATVSNTVDLDKVALSSGYMNSVKVYTPEKLEVNVKKAFKIKGPHFILIKVSKGTDKNLGRPELTPFQVKRRFMKSIEQPDLEVSK